ncbi:MAG: hypothetical protein ACYS76_14930 [Planctomycetota bacterium]|jgi:hypothetical protein
MLTDVGMPSENIERKRVFERESVEDKSPLKSKDQARIDLENRIRLKGASKYSPLATYEVGR